MSKQTMTLALEGEVELEDFSQAITNFQKLVTGMNEEVSSGAEIEWLIKDLSYSSAITTILGVYEDSDAVERVIIAYEKIGESLSRSIRIPYSTKVRKLAYSLTDVIGGNVTGIRFETSEKDWVITKDGEPKKPRTVKYSLGTVKGRVQTLSERGGSRFTLWDSLFDKSVSCYVSEEYKDIMRDIWGKNVVVSGRIGRQPETGLPIVIRNIRSIRLVKDVEPGSYKHAEGVLDSTEESPEQFIRRLRDG